VLAPSLTPAINLNSTAIHPIQFKKIKPLITSHRDKKTTSKTCAIITPVIYEDTENIL
jgi:hypothetical protein